MKIDIWEKLKKTPLKFRGNRSEKGNEVRKSAKS